MTVNRRPNYKFRSAVSPTCPDSVSGADLAIVGIAVDDRGRATTDALRARAKKVVCAKFDPKTQSLEIDGTPANAAARNTLLSNVKRLVLDTTTLGLGEVLQILRSFEELRKTSVSLLYVEPKSYHHQNVSSHGLDKEFSLTSNCTFTAVQGFALEYVQSHKSSHVFMLGFEPARLLNAIEQRNWGTNQAAHVHLILGVPAFKPGWEINSIRSHLQVMDDNGLTEANVRYCQANSIRESYLTLWSLYRDLGDDQGCLFISPLGTKPHAIGAALFLLETRKSDPPTSLYYDHPDRVPSRSADIAAWHVVDVNLSNGG